MVNRIRLQHPHRGQHPRPGEGGGVGDGRRDPGPAQAPETIDTELTDVRQRLGRLYNLVETTDMEVDDFKAPHPGNSGSGRTGLNARRRRPGPP